MDIYYLFNFIIFTTNSFGILKFLHIYQLKDYSNFRYFKYFLNFKTFYLFFCLFLLVFELLFKNIIIYIALNSFIYILNLFYLKKIIKSSKTPLKTTGKMSRLYIISILFLFLISLFKYSFLIVILATPLLPVLANTINVYDKILNKIFIVKAKNKLQNSNVKIVAITGSNGKTSVKNILLEMLSMKFKTQATPASYNTPLGIAKFINNNLKPETKFLILEYGARHKYDIKKLCNTYGADYGIITTISPQHIETFHSVENVFKTKKELCNFLENKPCVFNTDNLYCIRMFITKTGTKLSTSNYHHTNVYASNIEIKNNKTSFNININNKTYSSETSLLGEHNITNICLASALANFLGITEKQIISTIKNLKPTEHRLSLIKTHINILDDTYNCSLDSAKQALRVLQQFPGTKMVATPGIIECGKNKFKTNYKLGQIMSFCDYCLIIGNENRVPLLEGLKKEALLSRPHKCTYIFANTLEEAKRHFSKLHAGDTLLLLNDLPDDYS